MARSSPWPLALLTIGACVRAPPPPAPVALPPPPPPALVVPPGCLADLSGPYVHAREARFHYVAVDQGDGGLLELEAWLEPLADAGRPLRRFSRDGGLPWLSADAGPTGATERDAGLVPLASLRLVRTAAGFVGAVGPSSDGGCRFPVRVTACSNEGLVLESPSALGPDCAPLDAGWSAQVLRRPDAGAPSRSIDAGRDADAGLDTARHIGEDAGATGDAGGVSVPPSR